MRIAHLDSETWDSGLTEYALTLARAQMDAGHAVIFLAPKASHALERAKALGLETAFLSRNILAAGGATGTLRAFGAEVLNAHTGSAHSLAAVAKSFLPGKVALIRTRADARLPGKKAFASLLWGRTNGFIGANSVITAEFRKLFPAIPATTVLQGVADAGSPSPLPGKAIIGMLGRLDPVKGHDCALRAFALLAKELPSASLRIAGEDKNVKAEDLKKLCAELGISQRVEFYGRLPDVPAFMAGCDIGIAPSLGSEAVSRAAIEWQRAGRPVVASSVGGMGDLVDSGVTGALVPPGDPQVLAAAMLRLLAGAEMLRAAGLAARARYEKLFTTVKFAEDTLAFYEATLRGTAR